jgi:cytochrome c
MDSFELNKIAGAVLGTGLLVMALNMTAGALLAPGKVKVPGYELPGDAVAAAPAAAAAAADAPIEERMKTADVARGQRAVGACAACHTFDKGGANRVGPNLHNTVDQTKGHADGFGYSAALRERKAKGEKWDVASLDAFLKNPRAYMTGTSMSFAGISRAEQRADIIAYMQSLK